ncbi:MAG: endonuclease/exonuclease/phosphatase family protein [Gaiellales bacterium]
MFDPASKPTTRSLDASAHPSVGDIGSAVGGAGCEAVRGSKQLGAAAGPKPTRREPGAGAGLPPSATPAAARPPRGVTVDKTEETTVVSINVKAFQLSKGVGAKERAFEAIGDYIKDVDADVVLFQELDKGTDRSGGTDQLAKIAQRVQADDSEFAKAIDHQNGEYGVGILTRNGYEIADDAKGRNRATSVKLPKGTGEGADPEQRVALAAAIETPSGQDFTAITTHLANKGPGRSAQVDKLDDVVKDLRGGANNHAAGLNDDMPTKVVLGGDFNARRGPIEKILGDEVTHVADRYRKLGNTGIDHIYVSDDVKVVDAKLDKAQRVNGWLPFGIGAVKSTDHPAVRSTVKLD